MKIAFCRECGKVVAAGRLPESVRRGGKETPYRYTHAVIDAKGRVLGIHEAAIVEVSDTPRERGERAGHYLNRLAREHSSLLSGK